MKSDKRLVLCSSIIIAEAGILPASTLIIHHWTEMPMNCGRFSDGPQLSFKEFLVLYQFPF